MKAPPVSLLPFPYRELQSHQILALAVIYQAIRDLQHRHLTTDWFRLSDCTPWCRLAGLDVRYLRRHVLNHRRRMAFAAHLKALLATLGKPACGA